MDTHAFLWWIAGDVLLSDPARAAIGDTRNEVFVSAATAWEITTKVRIGKLPGAVSIAGDLTAVIVAHGFVALPITFTQGQMAGALAGPHKDPFDRMLVAQAMANGLILVSNEQRLDAFSVRRLW